MYKFVLSQSFYRIIYIMFLPKRCYIIKGWNKFASRNFLLL